MRCLDCFFLAGSDRTPQWLFEEKKGYCDHPDREGGPWNVLQLITIEERCERFRQATKEKVELRERALRIFEERNKCKSKTTISGSKSTRTLFR